MSGTTRFTILAHLERAVLRRLLAYAKARGIPPVQAAGELVAQALGHHDARAKGGETVAQRRTARQRSAAARHAALARWGAR